MDTEKATKLKEEFITVCSKKHNWLAWNDVDDRGNAIRINEVDGGEFYYRLIIDYDTGAYYLKKYCTAEIIEQAEIPKEIYQELLDKITIQ